MNKIDFMINLEEKILDCSHAISNGETKRLLIDVHSRLSFASGYLEKDFPFISALLDVIYSGTEDIPF